MIGDRSNTEGRRLFVAALARTTSRELARALRIKRAMVSAIASGTRRPSLDLAIMIELKIGIRCASWRLQATAVAFPLRVDNAEFMFIEKSGDDAA